MLRALRRFLGTGVPVIGVNFGRVGFLTAIAADELEDGPRRALRRRATRVVELPDARGRRPAASAGCAVNDVVVAERDARPDDRARLVDRRRGPRLAAVRRADLRDAVRARRRTTSRTAGRCSSGGSTRWRSPSSRRTRCTRGRSSCRAAGADRHEPDARRERDRARRRPAGARARAGRPGRGAAREQRSLLATLPESTFFSRYRRTFGSE